MVTEIRWGTAKLPELNKLWVQSCNWVDLEKVYTLALFSSAEVYFFRADSWGEIKSPDPPDYFSWFAGFSNGDLTELRARYEVFYGLNVRLWLPQCNFRRYYYLDSCCRRDRVTHEESRFNGGW